MALWIVVGLLAAIYAYRCWRVYRWERRKKFHERMMAKREAELLRRWWRREF